MSAELIAYIGLGSNLDEPMNHIQRALVELDELSQTKLVVASSLYRSDPMGPAGQPDYINSVAAVQTRLSAEALLSELQHLEALHQRVRRERWGPRTLDLDLLLYGNYTIQTEHLVVPHPGLAERNFVLIPLFEIAPDLILPDNRSLADLVDQCGNEGLEQL